MSTDASDRQEIQKFSFIESLNLSQVRSSNSHQPSQAAIASTSELTVKRGNNWQRRSDSERLDLTTLLNSTPTTPEPNLPARRNLLGKLLFALACSYGLFAWWWLFGHQLAKIPLALTGGKQVVLSKSEVQFIDYMERSLAKLERQKAKQDSTDDEVVFVPVYTPTPATPSVPQVLPNTPVAPPQPIEALKIPTPPPLPAPTSTVDNSATQKEIATATQPATTHTLIGVLELGDNKSAALVKVAGQTRKVEPGGKISDGWILEAVSDRQATISGGGEVRSVSVGETF